MNGNSTRKTTKTQPIAFRIQMTSCLQTHRTILALTSQYSGIGAREAEILETAPEFRPAYVDADIRQQEDTPHSNTGGKQSIRRSKMINATERLRQ